jgi:hypothetical protein
VVLTSVRLFLFRGWATSIMRHHICTTSAHRPPDNAMAFVAELEKLRHSHTSQHGILALTLQSVSYRWLALHSSLLSSCILTQNTTNLQIRSITCMTDYCQGTVR